MSQPGYPDKTPSKSPPSLTDGYNSHGTKTNPPAASQFNKGASDLEQIRRATEARREHSNKLSDPGRAGYKNKRLLRSNEPPTCHRPG
jgi:hypothetical protein